MTFGLQPTKPDGKRDRDWERPTGFPAWLFPPPSGKQVKKSLCTEPGFILVFSALSKLLILHRRELD